MFLNNIQALPSVGPFMWVSFDRVREFENGRNFRVIIYGAYNAGIIGSESNGIAILDDDKAQVLCDEISKADSGYFGPTKKQIQQYNFLLRLNWESFCDYVNNNNRTRYQIGGQK